MHLNSTNNKHGASWLHKKRKGALERSFWLCNLSDFSWRVLGTSLSAKAMSILYIKQHKILRLYSVSDVIASSKQLLGWDWFAGRFKTVRFYFSTISAFLPMETHLVQCAAYGADGSRSAWISFNVLRFCFFLYFTPTHTHFHVVLRGTSHWVSSEGLILQEYSQMYDCQTW